MTRCTLAVISVVTALSVIGYNLWAYCCGRCAAENFVQLGPFGLLLTGVTLVAGAALLILKFCRIRTLHHRRCRCGVFPAAGWAFCPRCGTSF